MLLAAGEQVAGRGLRVAVADRSRKSQVGQIQSCCCCCRAWMLSCLSVVRSGKKEGK